MIRYMRRCIKDGRINNPDVKDAICIMLGHVHAGGYRKRERRIPPETRAVAIKRDKGRCRQCGAAGTEIDHIDGPSVNLKNLQLLCHACHVKKTLKSICSGSPKIKILAIVEAESISKEGFFIDHSLPGAWTYGQWERIHAKHPLRPCDDEENWQRTWRDCRAKVRTLLTKRGRRA